MDEDIRKLAAEYYEALKGIRELKAKARKRREDGYADLVILKSMEKDVEWTIEYMLLGHIPSDKDRHRKVTKSSAG